MASAINLNETNSSALDNIASSFPDMFDSLVSKHPVMAFIALVLVVVSATLVCMIPLFGFLSHQKTKRLMNLREFKLKEDALKIKANEQKLTWLKMKFLKSK
ncbi:hypothetical protein VCHA54P499_270031 [Vibrio chagasii]|nr:hypothetical protein VCHA54P499_270031 [Vibrio chagasii]CAH7252460.1 hypothetical protein VCHA53O466_300028 [Vibrio chagasii]